MGRGSKSWKAGHFLWVCVTPWIVCTIAKPWPNWLTALSFCFVVACLLVCNYNFFFFSIVISIEGTGNHCHKTDCFFKVNPSFVFRLDKMTIVAMETIKRPPPQKKKKKKKQGPRNLNLLTSTLIFKSQVTFIYWGTGYQGGKADICDYIFLLLLCCLLEHSGVNPSMSWTGESLFFSYSLVVWFLFSSDGENKFSVCQQRWGVHFFLCFLSLSLSLSYTQIPICMQTQKTKLVQAWCDANCWCHVFFFFFKWIFSKDCPDGLRTLLFAAVDVFQDS